jgi:hypothetical protein
MTGHRQNLTEEGRGNRGIACRAEPRRGYRSTLLAERPPTLGKSRPIGNPPMTVWGSEICRTDGAPTRGIVWTAMAAKVIPFHDKRNPRQPKYTSLPAVKIRLGKRKGLSCALCVQLSIVSAFDSTPPTVISMPAASGHLQIPAPVTVGRNWTVATSQARMLAEIADARLWKVT